MSTYTTSNSIISPIKSKATGLLIFLSFFLFSAHLSAQTELISNGGFENGTGTAYSATDDWTNFQTDQTVNVRNTTNPFSGTYRGVVGNVSDPYQDLGHSIAIGDIYTLSFQYAGALNWDLGIDQFNVVLYYLNGTTPVDLETVTITPFQNFGTAYDFYSNTFSAINNAAAVGSNLHIRFEGLAGASEWASIDEVSLTLSPPGQTTFSQTINASTDDAEERVNATIGQMYLNSTDLELTQDNESNGGQQIVGLRFTNITIPIGATITHAYLTFNADNPVDDPGNPLGNSHTNLSIQGNDVADAATFTVTNSDISSRAYTSASVNWTPTAWTVGSSYNTNDISSVIQEIVDLSGWASGNDIAIIITGDGVGGRVVDSWDGTTGGAGTPQLTVIYSGLSVSISVTDALCPGTGSVLITATNGTAPYTYYWENNLGQNGTGSGLNISGLDAAEYKIQITDNTGTSVIDKFIIGEPDALATSFNTTYLSTAGASDGAIDLTISGGVPPYTHSWTKDGNAFSSAEDLTNLSAGLYEVTVTDDCNTIVTQSVQMTDCQAAANEVVIAGTVFIEQLPDDGAYDLTETGKAGISVYIIEDANCNGIFDTGDNKVNLTTTDINGKYSFTLSNITTPACYLTFTSLGALDDVYDLSILDTAAVTFNSLGICDKTLNLGLLAVVDAQNDNAVALSSPVLINVVGNDIGYLDLSSVSIVSGQNTSFGTLTNNNDGTFTYTPGPSYAGTDQFQYQVCSSDDPAVCDIATVNISDCQATANENIIGGVVFLEQLTDNGIYDYGETIKSGVIVQLFEDANCNSILDANENTPVSTTTSDGSGHYEFNIPAAEIQSFNAKDEFNTNGSYTGNDGSVNWSNNWQELGETNGASTNYVTVNSNALRIGGYHDNGGSITGRGAWRELDLSSALNASLTLDFTEAYSTGFDVILAISSNGGSTWTNLETFTFTTGNVSRTYNISSYTASNTRIRFLADGSIGEELTRQMFFDNIDITYDANVSASFPKCFITQIDLSNQNGLYVLSSLDQGSTSFAAAGTCDNGMNLGLLAVAIAKDDAASTVGEPVTINVLSNDFGNLDLSSISITSAASDGQTSINPDGSISYTPGASFSGLDEFSYQVCSTEDPQICATATVYIGTYKQLYLSENESLDRIDPVATNDNTTESISLGSICTDMITNGEFDNGTTDWNLYNQSGNVSTWSVDNSSQLSGANSAKVDITTTLDGTDWHIQLDQETFVLTAGQEYTIYFDAKASSSRNIEVTLQERASPWTAHYSQSVSLSTTAQSFGPFTFTQATTEPIAGILFNLGEQTGTVYIDNVKLLTNCSQSNSTSFTQSIPICEDLTILGGRPIMVETHIDVLTGTMPTNPNILASLNYNGTNLINIVNPTFHNGRLCWNGGFVNNTTVPAGQALELVITSSESDVEFTIDYDSQSSPSKVELPVSNYIQVESIELYTGAFPATDQVSQLVGGENYVVRVEVSDPFGNADITSLDLSIVDNLNNTTDVILTNANVVSTSTCTKTYEYAFTVAGVSHYNFYATAHEGYEDAITHTDSLKTVAVVAIDAVDDILSVTSGIPGLVNVLANDIGSIDVSSLTILIGPQNGSLQIGSNGHITYLPLGSFSGTDQFTYQVCNTDPIPQCDIGVVTVEVLPNFTDPCSEAVATKTFYMPFPENDTQLGEALFQASDNYNGYTGVMRNITSIKAPYPTTIIYYDHWEDGYEADITAPLSITTKIWGDGDLTNGIAPGYADDIIPAGGSIVLDNNFLYDPRDSTNIYFDGRDKIVTTFDVAISKVTGDNAVFAVQAAKTNVFDISRFGQLFTLGLGEVVGTPYFAYASLFVLASEDNTTVNIDLDADGTVDLTKTLNEGEVWFYQGDPSATGIATATDIVPGTIITADKPIGMDLLFGGNDNFGTRNINILPGQFYGDTYYTPVPTTNTAAPNEVLFVNSLPDTITINWQSNLNQDSLIVLPNRDTSLTLTDLSGYKFWSTGGESYTAVQIMDADASGSAYDWAITLITADRLTTFTSIAWAPGSLDGTRNDNPIWVTPTANTTIYVKYDGDLTDTTALMSSCNIPYDVAIPLNELEFTRIYDPDGDQSGMALFTCDSVTFAAVYGEDASSAVTGSPSLDVGTVLTPKCLEVLVNAVDDYEITEPNTPIIIDVSNNDVGFLTTVDPISVINITNPANGSIVVNPDGTITYTPNAGYLGEDEFEYSICSEDYATVCDYATVFIKITDCNATAIENLIKGNVFVEVLPDNGQYDIGEDFAAYVKVNLYADTNCNGLLDAGEQLIKHTFSDLSGNYSLSTINGFYASDDFDPTASFTGNDGSINWSTNWLEQGDNNVVNSGDVQILTDAAPGGKGNALRIGGGTNGASRSMDFSGATAATLKFHYRREGLDDAGEALLVQLNNNTIFTINDGNGVGTDNFYAEVVLPLSGYNATGTNTIQFISNGNLSSGEYFWIDNVELIYFKTPACFIVEVDPSNTNGAYTASSLNQQAVSFTGLGSCEKDADLGVLPHIIAVDDLGNVLTNTNTIIDILSNDIGKPDPASVTIDQQPTNGTVIVNLDGTVTYSPNPGYTGNDVFTYIVCSLEDPSLCDTATVDVVIGCQLVTGQNTINGGVFSDKDNNGTLDLIDVFDVQGIDIKLYEDINGNGLIDDGATPVTTTTNSNGAYQFAIPFTNTSNNVRDEFTVNNYGNNDGSQNWSANWVESDGGGYVGITGGELFMYYIYVGDEEIYRQADLSGSTVANLSFQWRTTNFDNGDSLSVQVSDNGGGSYTTLMKLGGSATTSGNVSVDISTYIASNTRIRFLNTTANWGSNEYIYIDNVDITYSAQSFTPNYVVEIDQTSFPAAHYLTTTSTHSVSFTGINQAVCEKDFGVYNTIITAIDDAGTVNGYTGGTAVNDVLNNDQLNGVTVDPNDITTPSQISSTHSGVNLSGNSIVVDPGTPAGTYNLVYEICDILKPTNCDQATVVVTVEPPPIVAEDDDASASPVIGYFGGTPIANVLTNDLLNGVAVNSAEVTVSVLTPASDPGVTLNTSTGQVDVAAGTPAGTYTINYQICEILNPSNCDPAVITVVVENNPPVAVNDINQTVQDSIVSGQVLTNDSDPDGELIQVTPNSGTTSNGGSYTINEQGVYVYTPPIGFTGTDTFTYEVCDNGTPALCDTATVTITVLPCINPPANPGGINKTP